MAALNKLRTLEQKVFGNIEIMNVLILYYLTQDES